MNSPSLLVLTAVWLSLSVPARAIVGNPEPLAQLYPCDDRLTPRQPLDQGQSCYQAGNFTTALHWWETALTQSQAQGDLVQEVQSLRALGVVHQELGEWTIATQHFQRAQTLLTQALSQDPHQTLLQAQLLNSQGISQFRQGQIHTAQILWEQAQQTYQQVGDRPGEVLSRLNKIQALQAQGFYHLTGKELEILTTQLTQITDPRLALRIHQSLARFLQNIDRTQDAENHLESAAHLAEQLGDPDLKGYVLLQQIHGYAHQGTWHKAMETLDRLKQLPTSPDLQLQGLANQLRILVEIEQPTQALGVWASLYPALKTLPADRPSILLQLHSVESLLNHTLLKDQSTQVSLPNILEEVQQILDHALDQSTALGDLRSQSLVLGQMGSLEEQLDQVDSALNHTRQAMALAQGIQAQDLLARWTWQEARLLKTQGKTQEALNSYRQTVVFLGDLRQDLMSTPLEYQFSFREGVEPVYRQFTGLLLDAAEDLTPQHPDHEQYLQEALQTMEDLQQLELANFFREACVDVPTSSIETLDPEAAVVYPMMLEDKIGVIVAMPQGNLQYRRIEDSALARMPLMVQHLRQGLNPAFPSNSMLQASQILYNWLVRPWEAEFEAQKVKTLVFMLDGDLRNIPMAVLHDGQRFLVERYRLGLVPSLQLVQPPEGNDRSLNRARALTGGLSLSRDVFAALPNVEYEIEALSGILANDRVLLNDRFTIDRVTHAIQNYPMSIVHLATHGQFSSKADETFLLAWDGRINVTNLGDVLKNRSSSTPVDLLVLSACQTAQGDNRASLGLAGMAVRSGARSTLGSLWSINDASTSQFITEFYDNLINNGQTKAEALQSAQVSMLRSQTTHAHPFYWAPFVLVGQWQ